MKHDNTKDRTELKAPGTGPESHIAGLNDPHTGHVVLYNKTTISDIGYPYFIESAVDKALLSSSHAFESTSYASCFAWRDLDYAMTTDDFISDSPSETACRNVPDCAYHGSDHPDVLTNCTGVHPAGSCVV